jgi:ATP-binding cassette subfamily F protein 3
MPLVTVDNVEKSFAAQRLFAKVTFALDARDHAVLVGRNGSGKTTLLRMLSGAARPDAGKIVRARGRRFWLHEQTPELTDDRPVREYLMDAFADITRLETEVRDAELRLSALVEGSPELDATLADYQRLQRRFELAGGYHYRADLEGVLAGLGLPAAMLDRPLLSLSGGELTRITLARALLADADLLLLDEPTNHLDIDSVEWLEDFLVGYPKAFVLVTHDRRLLERVGSRVVAIEDDGTVATVGADFATYLREREAAAGLVSRKYDQDSEKIAQLQRFYDRFHAKKDLAKRAQAKLTQIQRIRHDMVAPRQATRGLRLNLPQPRPSARVVLELKAPTLSVGGPGGGGGGGGAARPPPPPPPAASSCVTSTSSWSAASAWPSSVPTARARPRSPRASSASVRWPAEQPTWATTSAPPTSRSRAASSTSRRPCSAPSCR